MLVVSDEGYLLDGLYINEISLSNYNEPFYVHFISLNIDEVNDILSRLIELIDIRIIELDGIDGELETSYITADIEVKKT